MTASPGKLRRWPSPVTLILLVGAVALISALIFAALDGLIQHSRKKTALQILADVKPNKFRISNRMTSDDGFKGMAIFLQGTDIGDNELYYIGQLDDVLAFDISNTSVSPVGLRRCDGFHELRQLHLSHTSVGESVWAVVQKFPKLTFLDVSWSKVTGEQITNDVKLLKLFIFSGNGAAITDSGLEKICDACPNVEALSVSETLVTSSSSTALSALKKLSALSIDATSIDDRFVEQLSPDFLKRLHVLSIRSTRISKELIVQLCRDYPHLRVDHGELTSETSGLR